MSCGTAHFATIHWQKTLCNGNSKVVLQCLIKAGGIPSSPVALSDAKLSMALPNSSTDGSESNASMVGKHLMASRDAGYTMVSLEYR